MRFVYYALALVFFLLGLIGVFLPGIPTTPFLLLMSFFLLKVSPSLHAKVLQWPLVGKPIRDWHEKGGIRPQVKWTAISMVVLLVSLSLYLGSLHWIAKLIVVIAAAIGVTVVVRLPTIRETNDEA